MIGMDSDEATLEMAIAMESVDEIIPVDRPHLMKRRSHYRSSAASQNRGLYSENKTISPRAPSSPMYAV